MKIRILVFLAILFVGGCSTSEEFRRLEYEQQRSLQRIKELDEERLRIIQEGNEKCRRWETTPLRIGMTKAEVIQAWGDTIPKFKNRTVTKNNISEQWVYSLGNESWCKPKYVYFENGILTSYQE